MKFKKTIFLSLLILLAVTKTFSQNYSDTIPYKIKEYEVKKQQKVIELAQQLKVDPEIILKLNHLRSAQRDLVTGLHIKIPVYAKGYKYEVPVVRIEVKVKTAESEIDSSAKGVVRQPEKERKKPAEQAKKKPQLGKLPTIQQQPVTKVRTTEAIRKNYDPEIDNNNLMLVDATLELNEAMLAGIKASLDTLGKPEPEINGNNVKEILQRMKRARDRTELKPYLEYMNDSISLDCNKLHMQKEDILSRLTPYYEHLRFDSLAKTKQNDDLTATTTAANTKTVIAPKKKEKPQTIANAVIIKDTIIKKTEVTASNSKTNQKQKDLKNGSTLDTIIVMDMAKAPEMKPGKEKTHKPSPSVAKKDTTTKPVNDSLKQNQIAEQKKAMWDTARVVIDSALVLKQKQIAQKKEAEKITADSIATAKKKIQKTAKVSAKTDSSAIAKKQIEQKKITEPVKKTDTVAQSPKTVAIKPVEHKDNNTIADTIQHIKSQFFLKRAQKAITERKGKQAEEYLNKSLELWNDNYETWMTLADQDALLGVTAKALKEYQECLRIDSSKPKLFYNIAALYLQSKKKTEAVEYFNKTLSIDSTYILAYMGRATVYNDWKKYDEALSDYDKVLQINKSYHYAYKARGMVNQLNKRFSEAVDDFTRYLIFEETDPSAYYYRGLAKIGNKELLDGCLDLSKSAEMGYDAAEKAIKKSCE